MSTRSASGTPYSSQDYFAEAMTILEESGFPDLTAAGLCQRLGVTRGSFYHHFGSFDGFIEQFLEYWSQQYSARLIEASSVPDVQEAARRQVELAIGLPHRAEAAIRAWSTINPVVAQAQQRVDDLRHEALAASLVRAGVDGARADVYATIASTLLAGLQVTGRADTPDEVRAVFVELAGTLGVELFG